MINWEECYVVVMGDMRMNTAVEESLNLHLNAKIFKLFTEIIVVSKQFIIH